MRLRFEDIAFEERFKPGTFQRTGEIETLNGIKTQALKNPDLIRGFYAFGDCFHPEGVHEFDDGTDHGTGFGIDFDVIDEGLIDF